MAKKLKKLTKKHPKYQEIKEKCKELFITPNGNGNYMTNVRIVSKLSELFSLDMTERMIRFWRDQEGWEELRSKSKMIEVAKSRSKEATQEEKLINKIQEQVAEMYKQSDSMSKIAASIIAQAYKDKKMSARDAITLLKSSVDTKLRLLGIEEKRTVKVEDSRAKEIAEMSEEDFEQLKAELISEVLGENEK